MENRFYERIKTNGVPNEFRLSPAAAAARATVGGRELNTSCASHRHHRWKDTVYARVFEPEECSGSVPTLIYGGGLALAYDQIRYWPAKDYIGRPLAAEGCRVILVESPWHGRRMPPGYFSGEPYLAHAPVSLFQLYSAQAQETAILVDWVRSLGSPTVAVGGISLGPSLRNRSPVTVRFGPRGCGRTLSFSSRRPSTLIG
jgi:hypothetical protein